MEGYRQKMPKKTANKNPLRPVVGERLRVALSHAGLSNRELSKQLTDAGIFVRSPTLDYITSDPQKQMRCRESLINGICDLLKAADVPGSGLTPEWFMGEQDVLPFFPLEYMFNPAGTGIGGPGVACSPALLEALSTAPTRTQLVLNDFMAKCHAAIMRELHVQYGEKDAKREYEQWGKSILSAFLTLIDSRAWGLMWLKHPERARHKTSFPGAAEIVRAWEVILEPWFTGRDELNLEAFLQFKPMLLTEDVKNIRRGIRKSSTGRRKQSGRKRS